MSNRTVEGIGLYPEDREYVERIRRTHGLTSLASVVRHALKVAAEHTTPSPRSATIATPGGLPPVLAPPSQGNEAPSGDGARLSTALHRAGWTRGDLARHLECNVSSVRNVEIGKAPLAECCGGAMLLWVETAEKEGVRL